MSPLANVGFVEAANRYVTGLCIGFSGLLPEVCVATTVGQVGCGNY